MHGSGAGAKWYSLKGQRTLEAWCIPQKKQERGPIADSMFRVKQPLITSAQAKEETRFSALRGFTHTSSYAGRQRRKKQKKRLKCRCNAIFAMIVGQCQHS